MRPVAWPAVLVRDNEDDEVAVLHPRDELVGKSLEQKAPKLLRQGQSFDDGAGLGKLRCVLSDVVHFIEQLTAEARALDIVPSHRVDEVLLGVWVETVGCSYQRSYLARSR